MNYTLWVDMMQIPWLFLIWFHGWCVTIVRSLIRGKTLFRIATRDKSFEEKPTQIENGP
jgi:hypothetical protein